MPNVSKIAQGLLDLLANNPKTAKFARSLNQADLPSDFHDDSEIVDVAGKLWQEMGTESPFFKSWFGNSKIVDESGKPKTVSHVTMADMDADANPIAPFNKFKEKYGGIYTTYFTPEEDAYLINFGGPYPWRYELFANPQNILDARSFPKGKKGKFEKSIKKEFDRESKKEIAQRNDLERWEPVESFLNGEFYPEVGRKLQNRTIENLRSDFGSDAVLFNDPVSYPADGAQSLVVFDPNNLKSANNNQGTFSKYTNNIYKGLGGLGLLDLLMNQRGNE